MPTISSIGQGFENVKFPFSSVRISVSLPSPVPPPQRPLPPPKPLRGQADSRHSQQKHAPDRGPPSSVPTSPEKSRKGPKPLPGFRPRRKEPKSFFPAARTAGKIPLTEQRVKRVQPQGAGPVSRQSAVQIPTGSTGEAFAIAPPPKRRRGGAPGKRRRPPPLPGLSSAKRLRRFTDDSHARYDPRTPGRPGRRRSRRCGRC